MLEYNQPIMRCVGRSAVIGVVLLAATLVFAEPVNQLQPTNYANDFAHVLSAQTQNEVNEICRQLDEKAQAKVAVVTIDSTDSDSIEDYAVELFKHWGLGTSKTNRGVLILVAVKDHKYRTEVGYGLEPILPDGKVGGFWREAVPSLKQSDYDGAIGLVTQRVAAVIAQDAGIQLTGVRSPPERRGAPRISASAIVFFVILAIIVLATPLRKVLFWWLLLGGGPGWGGGYRGGGSGGWGGGGFGGGGGGGFGGFGGGGMSGGGGASGSW